MSHFRLNVIGSALLSSFGADEGATSTVTVADDSDGSGDGRSFTSEAPGAPRVTAGSKSSFVSPPSPSSRPPGGARSLGESSAIENVCMRGGSGGIAKR